MQVYRGDTPHLDEVNKLVVDVGSLGQEETVARTELMEEVQLLISAKLAMVSLGSFFLQADRDGMSTGKNMTGSLPAPLNWEQLHINNFTTYPMH